MSYTRKDNSRRIENHTGHPQSEPGASMNGLFSAIQIIPASLLILVGAPMLPVIAQGHYEATLLGVLVGEALLFLFLTRAADTQYRIATFAQALWLFAFA